MLNFNDRGTWWTGLAAALEDQAGGPARAKVAAASHEFCEDACDLLLSSSDREAVLDAVIEWIQSMSVAACHGSRLTDGELGSVRADGLRPLDYQSRKARLKRALSHHPRWPEVKSSLDQCLWEHGPGGKAGNREGQVHLTLSRQGLIGGFDQYLTHGSEFDQRVAHALLGCEGLGMLRQDGRARVIAFEVSGQRALAAAHPHFSIDDPRGRGDLPNLARELLRAWSYGLAHPDFDYGTLHVDCGLVFSSTVPSAWIVDIETLTI